MTNFEMLFALLAALLMVVILVSVARKRRGGPMLDFSLSANMVQLGILLMLIAAVGACFALSMETSVTTDVGDRVANLDLMSQQQNLLLLFGFVGVIGALLATLVKRRS